MKQERWAIAKMTARCALYNACPKNRPQSLSTPTATFSEIFNEVLFRYILWMCVQNLKFVALPVPEIIAIEVMSGGCGKRRPYGVVDGTVRKRDFLRSNFSSIFTRFTDIAAFVLQRATFPHPLVSPKFPHVPLEVGRWPLSWKQRRYWAICPCN